MLNHWVMQIIRDNSQITGQLLTGSLRESGAPLSLKALTISGDDLLPLFRTAGVPLSRMGGVLNALWERAVSGRVPNRREELLGAAEQMLAALPENEVSLCGKRTF